jgi:23S rRNA pseudouridine1911/1915/1917 synthase
MASPRKVEQPAPLLAWLFGAWPEAKRNTVRGWLADRRVAVNGDIVSRFDHALQPGDLVAIRSESSTAPDTRIAGGILLRHEDEAVIVIEKPAGLRSIASEAESEATAYALLTSHVRRGNPRSRERVWIVHRLDQETSGLMVFARTEAAKRVIQDSWESAKKIYRAVIEGAPPRESGVLISYLDEADRFRVRVAPEGPQTRRAVTRYRVEQRTPDRARLELELETGRRHQIRVQLAEAGCPIVGDKRYGAQTNPVRRVALHASELRFRHPVSGLEMRFVSPLPGEFGVLMKAAPAAGGNRVQPGGSEEPPPKNRSAAKPR